MATKGIAVQASRFALLKVEDDEDISDQDTKSKQLSKGGQQSQAAKKKNKKKKKAENADAAELRSLAFGGPKPTKLPNRPTPASGKAGGDATEKQWDEWKKLDQELTGETYEKDLQQALLLSKLEYEHTKVENVNGDNRTGSSSTTKEKKKKKKDKPSTMTLEEFNKLEKPDSRHNSESLDHEEYEICPPKPKLNTKVVEPDAKFFDKVEEDVSKIIQKEKIQEEYQKHYIVETARTQMYKEDLEKRDMEIKTLKDRNQELEEELKQVKKRNQQLCIILSQGEMKDKKEVIFELEHMSQVKDELTDEVSSLTTQLEKERSTVHALREEVTKLKGGKYGK